MVGDKGSRIDFKFNGGFYYIVFFVLFIEFYYLSCCR